MWTHFIIAPVVLAAACGLWGMVTLYMAKHHPDIRGPEDSAGGCCSGPACSSGGSCSGGDGHCAEHAERHPEELVQLRPLPEARVSGPRH